MSRLGRGRPNVTLLSRTPAAGAPTAAEQGAAALGLAATAAEKKVAKVTGTCALGAVATSATTIGGAGPTSPIYETFDSYSTGSAWAEGSIHGGWYVNFAGGGTIIPVDEPTRRVLQLESVTGLSDPGGTETAASLVTSTVSTTGDITLRARVRTVAQLRTGYSPSNTPNAWETAWLGWNYTEPSSGVRRFYYVALKTGGIELGKVDQSIALPGGQRFLFTDSTPFPLLSWCDVLVWQVGARIRVWINGVSRVDFTDGVGSLGTPNWGTSGEVVMTTGAAALYHEDARAQFDHIALAGSTAATNVTGATALGLATTAAEKKVAKVTGTTALGLAGTGVEKKSAPQTGATPLGVAATGAARKAAPQGGRAVLSVAGTGTERKAAVERGVAALGLAGAGTETAAATATRPPTVLVVSARRSARYDIIPGALIIAAPVEVALPTGQHGVAALGLTATAAEKKVAKVTGAAALGLAGTGLEKKSAPAQGATATALTAAAAERKVAPERGTAAVGLAGLHSGTQTRAVSGVCALGGTGTSTPRKTATEWGVGALGAAGTGVDRKVATGRGTVTLGLAGTRSGVASRPVAGTAALGLAGGATPRKTATEWGVGALGAAGTGVERKVATGRGTAALGLAATRSGVTARPVAGACTLALAATGTPRKAATSTGTGALGAVATGLQRKRGTPTGAACLGLAPTGLQARRSRALGATALGLAGSGRAGKRVGCSGVAELGLAIVGATIPIAPVVDWPLHPGELVDNTAQYRSGVVVDNRDLLLAGAPS